VLSATLISLIAPFTSIIIAWLCTRWSSTFNGSSFVIANLNFPLYHDSLVVALILPQITAT
jgi:hypothetical protein